MKSFAKAGSVAALLISAVVYASQDPPKMPDMPGPQKEHEWLQQLVGEWESEAEMMTEPGKPAKKCKGRERIRALGGFWIVADIEGKTPTGQTMQAVMSLGYDPQKKKYIGTWIDSMINHMWTYEGSLDDAKKVLTLNAEGPSFTVPGKTAKYRDIIEIKSKDHKTLTSAMQGDDGKWTSFGTVNYQRKK